MIHFLALAPPSEARVEISPPSTRQAGGRGARHQRGPLGAPGRCAAGSRRPHRGLRLGRPGGQRANLVDAGFGAVYGECRRHFFPSVESVGRRVVAASRPAGRRGWALAGYVTTKRRRRKTTLLNINIFFEHPGPVLFHITLFR